MNKPLIYEMHCGDNLAYLRTLPDDSFDCCGTDSPYGLKFMGKGWDHSVPSVELWKEVFRVLKPGAHLFSFFGTRTYHRGVVAIEDAGFEIRDQIAWVYGSGFPKSLDVAKAMDKSAGVIRTEVVRSGVKSGSSADGSVYMPGLNAGFQPRELLAPVTKDAKKWDGWGTALKPAWEPIVVARKPFKGTVEMCVKTNGTGAINIDACRIPLADGEDLSVDRQDAPMDTCEAGWGFKSVSRGNEDRWPANLAHDGSEECLEQFSEASGQRGDLRGGKKGKELGIYGKMGTAPAHPARVENSTSSARFFYCAKASRFERDLGCDSLPDQEGGQRSNTSGQHITRRDGGDPGPVKNNHPTVKPIKMMRWLVRMFCPPGSHLLEVHLGSGPTMLACVLESVSCTGVDNDPQSVAISRARVNHLMLNPDCYEK